MGFYTVMRLSAISMHVLRNTFLTTKEDTMSVYLLKPEMTSLRQYLDL